MSSSPSVLGPAGGLGRLNDVLNPTGRPGRKPAQGSTMVRGRRRRGGRRRRAVYALRASCPVPTCRPRAGSRLTTGLLAPYFSPGAACCLQGRSKAGALGQTRLEYGTKGGVEAACPRASRAARRAASCASRPTCRALGGLEASARQVRSTVYMRMCRALSRPGFRRAAPCSCALRMGVSFTAT